MKNMNARLIPYIAISGRAGILAVKNPAIIPAIAADATNASGSDSLVIVRHRPDLNREIREETGLAIQRSTRLCHDGNLRVLHNLRFLKLS